MEAPGAGECARVHKHSADPFSGGVSESCDQHLLLAQEKEHGHMFTKDRAENVPRAISESPTLGTTQMATRRRGSSPGARQHQAALSQSMNEVQGHSYLGESTCTIQREARHERYMVCASPSVKVKNG